MTEQEKFDRAVNVLVQAFLNDTLEHGSCTRCAVGNLVGALAYPGAHEGMGRARGIEYVLPNGEIKRAGWFSIMRNGNASWMLENEKQDGEEQRAALGYTWQQIEAIEKAFEEIKYNQHAMYDGMMAVVTELALIHGVDLEHAHQAQELFVRA